MTASKTLTTSTTKEPTLAQLEATMAKCDKGYRAYMAARTEARTAKGAAARKAAAAQQEQHRAAYTGWNGAARQRRALLAPRAR